ncbi:hypothetical protein D3C72_2111580 [compost metagenome]
MAKFMPRSIFGGRATFPNIAPAASHRKSTTIMITTQTDHLVRVSVVPKAGSKMTNDPNREAKARKALGLAMPRTNPNVVLGPLV